MEVTKKIFALALLFLLPLQESTADSRAVRTRAIQLQESQTVTFIPISVDDITIVIPYGTGLPNDPGNAGDSTLEGIDEDNDGIRDDVERAISLKYPHNPSARSFSYILAENYQQVIENPYNTSIQNSTYQAIDQADSCLKAIIDPIEEERGSDYVLPLVMNTKERSLRYVDALSYSGGKQLPATIGCR